MRLHEEGWESHDGVPSHHSINGPRLFQTRFDALPLSYFATLVSSANVFAKGAGRIRHDGSDGYYRALLLLDESRLRPLLPGLEDQSHASIMEAIKDVDAGPVVAGAPIQEMPVPEPMPALLNALPPIAPQLGVTGFERCVADLGPGTFSMKVWFDNYTGGSGKKRGWCDCCERHKCIKYRQVYGTVQEFCVGMWLWARYARDDATISKPDHIRYWPAADAIKSELHLARLRPF